MYIFEQQFSRTKHRKNEISSEISEKHIENSLRTATTYTDPDTVLLVSQKQGQKSWYFSLV